MLRDSLDLCIGSFFEMSLYQGGQYINKSFGSDNFHVYTTLHPNWRICGSGRNRVIQLPFEEFPESLLVQKSINLSVEAITQLEIICKNNIFLTKNNFIQSLDLLVVISGEEHLIHLSNHEDDITPINHGRFLINVSNILLKNSSTANSYLQSL